MQFGIPTAICSYNVNMDGDPFIPQTHFTLWLDNVEKTVGAVYFDFGTNLLLIEAEFGEPEPTTVHTAYDGLEPALKCANGKPAPGWPKTLHSGA